MFEIDGMDPEDWKLVEASLEVSDWLCPLDDIRVGILEIPDHLATHTLPKADWFHEEGKPIDWRS